VLGAAPSLKHPGARPGLVGYADNATFSAAAIWLNPHDLHFVLSLHCGQTTDGEKRDGSNLIIWSTAFGMETPRAQARRRTDTDAIAENCGE
jgi:hypothetical protein